MCSINFSERFKWTQENEVLMLREVFASKIWLTKPGSLKRSDGWRKILDNLSQVERPKFGVSCRAVRDHFQNIFAKRKSQNRREESASGIIPETTEKDVLLDELRKLFDAAIADKQAASQQANKNKQQKWKKLKK